MITINVNHSDDPTKVTSVDVENHVDICPHCNKSQNPNFRFGFLDPKELFLSYLCVRNDCKGYFVALFRPDFRNSYQFSRFLNGIPNSKYFSKHIYDISRTFVNIYNQAYEAEIHGLNDICGMGYRKALEFLLKDYLIQQQPENENGIANSLLGKCIDLYVNNPILKQSAKRAVWLGNDETHYIRKWETMDVNYLKKLINLSVHWIEMEAEHRNMLENMPEGKK